SPTCLDVGQLAAEDYYVNQVREFGSHRVTAEQLVIRLRAGSAIAILIGDGNQALVEQRVALPRYLDPWSGVLRVAVLAEYLHLTSAGGRINTDDLLVTAQFAYRNHQRHEMNVESALGILTRRTKLQEIEDGVDVTIETIVTLSCE